MGILKEKVPQLNLYAAKMDQSTNRTCLISYESLDFPLFLTIFNNLLSALHLGLHRKAIKYAQRSLGD